MAALEKISAAPDDVVLDSSVLINFLAISRVDLLGKFRRYRFLVTAHVRSEITNAAQFARLNRPLRLACYIRWTKAAMPNWPYSRN